MWQVRDELTERLCDDAETCRVLERGGLDVTTSLDWRLQKLAEKWVKAATIVPHAKSPRRAAKALGLDVRGLDAQPARARTCATAR